MYFVVKVQEYAATVLAGLMEGSRVCDWSEEPELGEARLGKRVGRPNMGWARLEKG